MEVRKTELDGVLIVEPAVFEDQRGFFLETYHQQRYHEHGIKTQFVQDNLSYSKKATLRGLHYQYPQGQAKLVQVLDGEVFDVAVDMRQGSPTFGRWIGEILSHKNKRQLFIPEGIAHGFCVLSGSALFHYKCSAFYAPQCEGGLLWSDPDLAIDWPVKTPVVSDKDRKLPCLKDLPAGRLPPYEKPR